MSTMELALALDLLSPRPVASDGRQAVCPGAWLPMPLPMAWIEAGTRSDWLTGDPSVPAHLRLQAALEAGHEARAWRICRSLGRSPMTDVQVAGILARWAARRQADLALPATTGPVVLAADTEDAKALRLAAEAALRDVQRLYASLTWPRWAGPGVVVPGEEALGRLAAEDSVHARYALPLIRIPQDAPVDERQELLADRWCALVLAMEAGDEPWPAWFEIGMRAMARARARGEGPSPRAMQALRQRHGVDAIRRCLLADEPDPELAFALCAYAAHTRRVRHLPALMEVLRNQADGISAFEIAYRADLETLASER